MLVRRLSVMVVVFTCTGVFVPAFAVCPSWVRKRWKCKRKKDKQKGNETAHMLHFLYIRYSIIYQFSNHTR